MTEFTQGGDVEGRLTRSMEALGRILSRGNVSCDAKKRGTVLFVCSHDKELIKPQSDANSSRRVSPFPEKL